MRRRLRLSQEEMAERLDFVHKSSISKYENDEGDLPQTLLLRIDEKFGAEWSRFVEAGIEPKKVEKDEKVAVMAEPPYRLKEEQKIGTIQSLKQERGEVRFVPVVSWASAGRAHDYQEMKDFIDEEARSTAKHADCFALQIEGDSMEPKYSAGDRVVIDPHREARNGNRVVARLRESEGVLFKVYNIAGDEVTLVSYNPLYPPLKFKKKDFLWIYPVTETIRKEPL